MPMYYYVPEIDVQNVKSGKDSMFRCPSEEGSISSKIFLWGQAMMIISDLLTSQLISVNDLDPIRRYLPSPTRPKGGGRYSTFEVRLIFRNILF